jgi:hypothetical protein
LQRVTSALRGLIVRDVQKTNEMKAKKLPPLGWMTLWFITLKAGNIGSFGEWSWIGIFAPLYAHFAFWFVVALGERIIEEINEIKTKQP